MPSSTRRLDGLPQFLDVSFRVLYLPTALHVLLELRLVNAQSLSDSTFVWSKSTIPATVDMCARDLAQNLHMPLSAFALARATGPLRTKPIDSPVRESQFSPQIGSVT